MLASIWLLRKDLLQATKETYFLRGLFGSFGSSVSVGHCLGKVAEMLQRYEHKVLPSDRRCYH